MRLSIHDYAFLIQDDIYNICVDNQNSIRTKSELAAYEQIKSYLNGRYNDQEIFLDVQPYNNNATYSSGAIVEFDFEPNDYDDSFAYAVGDYITYISNNDERNYICTVANTGKIPTNTAFWQQVGHTYTAIASTVSNNPTNNTFWELGDKRHPLIVMYMIDLALYHVHARISPQNIPQIRVDRYDEAMIWLKGVAKGTITPDLPKAIDPKTGEGSSNLLRLGGNNRLFSSW